MLALIKNNWLTSVTGVLGAALAAFALTPQLASMSATQAFSAFGACLFVALKGLLSADATKPQ